MSLSEDQLNLLKHRRRQGIAFAAAKRFPGDKEKSIAFVKRVESQTDKKVAKLGTIRANLVANVKNKKAK